MFLKKMGKNRAGTITFGTILNESLKVSLFFHKQNKATIMNLINLCTARAIVSHYCYYYKDYYCKDV